MSSLKPKIFCILLGVFSVVFQLQHTSAGPEVLKTDL